MVKRFYKHKILLDENMPPRSDFPRLNEYFNVKHVDHDLGHSGIPDDKAYDLAVSQERIILTRNIKHFAPLAGTKDDAGIIGIPPHWSPLQLDKKLTAFLMHKSPKSLQGKLSTLDEENVEKKKTKRN